MPNKPLFKVPEVESYEPQWSPPKNGAAGVTDKPPTKAQMNQRLENNAGPLKPLAQFMNMLASPDVKTGIFTGPVNAVSKLGNMVGDLVQRKPVDVRDAWVITDKAARQYSPFRVGLGQEVTPADEAGLPMGGAIGGQLAGTRLLGAVAGLATVKNAAQALKATQAVKNVAVAAKVSPGLRAGLNVTAKVGDALVNTAAAVPFVDASQGNLANVGDAFGLKLPGRVEPGDNYLQALGKTLAVEGIAAPLAVIGGGAALIKPFRRGLATGGMEWLDELADAELAPYMPKAMTRPALPPAAAGDLVDKGSRSLPAFGESSANYGELFQRMEAGPAQYGYDSAIGRSLQEQTQIRQVGEQRQRLEGMGLVQRGEGGQLEFSLDAGVDPETKLQIRQLQTQRGQLIKQNMATGEDVSQQLAEIDQQIGDMIQTGRAQDAMDARPPMQPELDLPDGRPELDTYLAHLDELSDPELRQLHSRVWAEDGAIRMKQEQEGLTLKVQEIQQKIADLDGEQLTDLGRKRKLTRFTKELDQVQQELTALEGRGRVKESLVGDQLEMAMDQQLGLDLAPEVKLPPFQEVTRTASEFGYQTADDYRNSLQGWKRDQLRRLAMPDSSPEVAALVKARTGRRVWQAKKSDIIDALVEISQRRGRYLPPAPEQLAMELRTNKFGDAAPLFDQPADLSAPGMVKTLDADGNEVAIPAVDYAPRGMDAQSREQLKARILQRAIANGEVQAPFSPLPERPSSQFDQGSLVEQLMADETGQLPLAYATDALPTYKAGGKGADDLIEEMRLRFQYHALDEEAQRVQRQAYMAAHGWDTLSWEERKKLGVLGEGFYSLEPYADRFREPTPAFTPELPVKDAAAPAPYKLEPYTDKLTFQDGESVVVPKEMAPPPTKEAVQAKRAEAMVEKKRAKGAVTALDKEQQALLKQREALIRQQQGAKC